MSDKPLPLGHEYDPGLYADGRDACWATYCGRPRADHEAAPESHAQPCCCYCAHGIPVEEQCDACHREAITTVAAEPDEADQIAAASVERHRNEAPLVARAIREAMERARACGPCEECKDTMAERDRLREERDEAVTAWRQAANDAGAALKRAEEAEAGMARLRAVWPHIETPLGPLRFLHGERRVADPGSPTCLRCKIEEAIRG